MSHMLSLFNQPYPTCARARARKASDFRRVSFPGSTGRARALYAAASRKLILAARWKGREAARPWRSHIRGKVVSRLKRPERVRELYRGSADARMSRKETVMPMYDYRCDDGHRFERMLPLARYREPQQCSCGAASTRLITAPQFSVENVEYDCPITGKMITSRHAHEQNLREHGCRVYEPGETQATERARAEANEAFERSIDETVEREWESYSSDTKERLTNELTHGIDVSYERSTNA